MPTTSPFPTVAPSPLSHRQAAEAAREYADFITAQSLRRKAGKSGPPPSWIHVYMRRYRALTGRTPYAGPRPKRGRPRRPIV